MRLGLQTIIWGPRVDDIGDVLRFAADAGFRGIEIFQRPEFLGDAQVLRRRLDDLGLSLVSLAGGTLTERIDYCGEVLRPEYMYIEDWDNEACNEAERRGFVLALHPHVFMRIHRMADAVDELTKHPGLKLVPDAAHLYIAGDDPVKVVGQWAGRIPAVHLKDWRREYGRSAHRYAKGFVELGVGEVPLRELLKKLCRDRFAGWIVVGQDSTVDHPCESIGKSVRWLAETGLVRYAARTAGDASPTKDWRQMPPLTKYCPPGTELDFLRSLSSAGVSDLQSCYRRIASAFAGLIPESLVSVWTYVPDQCVASVLAACPEGHVPADQFDASQATWLTGQAIARHAVTQFDLAEKANREHFSQPEMLKNPVVKFMTSVPVLDRSNPNHVRLLVNILHPKAKLPVSFDDLAYLSQYVAMAVDIALDECCRVATARADSVAATHRQPGEFLKGLVGTIVETCSCEGASVFLVNEARDRLVLKGTTGIDWLVPQNERFYRKGEKTTGWVWERNETKLLAHIENPLSERGKSEEKVSTSARRDYMLVPMDAADRATLGVVRCRNRATAGGRGTPGMFSYDDAAVLESLVNSAAAHLEMLLDLERRTKAMGFLAHELKNPLVGVLGAASLMADGLRRRGFDPARFFDFDYLGDVESWGMLMRRLLGNADFFGFQTRGLQLAPERTHIKSQVVAPVVRQVELLCRERRFSPRSIRCGNFDKIPPLWVDRNQLQQVAFNLLSNAIKHAFADPSAFAVEVDGTDSLDGYEIRFRDWGPGVEEGEEERIFEREYRSPVAIREQRPGQGLGLWVVRQVSEAHGGRVRLSSRRGPTEITIWLPRALAVQAPRLQNIGGDPHVR